MDFNKMLQQAQAMQKNMGKIQKELEETIYEGSASNNLVNVKVKGSFEVVELNIDQSIIDPNDKEMLQDVVVLALNDAINKAKEDAENKMGSLTGGLKIPGLF